MSLLAARPTPPVVPPFADCYLIGDWVLVKPIAFTSTHSTDNSERSSPMPGPKWLVVDKPHIHVPQGVRPSAIYSDLDVMGGHEVIHRCRSLFARRR